MRFLFLVLPLLLAACGLRFTPHRIEIQQGNFVTQEMVTQLKLGMTRDQVRFVLGTPLLTDIFHSDRWEYVFLRRKADSREVERRRVSVFFEDNKLQRLEGDVVPATPVAGAESERTQQ